MMFAGQLEFGSGKSINAMHATPRTPLAACRIHVLIEEKVDIGEGRKILIPGFRRVFVEIPLIGILVVEDADAIVEFEPAGIGKGLRIAGHLADGMPSEGSFADARD